MSARVFQLLQRVLRGRSEVAKLGDTGSKSLLLIILRCFSLTWPAHAHNIWADATMQAF